MLETRLIEEEEKAKRELDEKAAEEEKDAKLKDYVISRFDFITNHTNPPAFLEHLVSGWGLQDKQAAKQYIFNTFVEAGHPVEKVKKIRMLKEI